MKLKPEILSPAGSFEAFLAAIHGGCDAVYLGGARFGARANAKNFTREEITRAIEIAHLYNRKVYYTANTMIKESEIQPLLEEVDFLYQEGIDAVILQDMGAYALLREHFPDCLLHASTQMTVHSLSGVKRAEALGFDRVVLSRELSLSEIRKIKEVTEIELECFVHGALCYCYSGQCYMSSILGGRSGNRGTCAQPCRLPYQLGNETRESYWLSPKDIQTLNILPQLLEAGIDSLKIEGRMKSPTYVGFITSLYRYYVDLYHESPNSYRVDPSDITKMQQIFNRGGFSNGYYSVRKGPEMMSTMVPKHQGVQVGKVESLQPGGIKILFNTRVSQGDCLEISGESLHSFTIREDITSEEYYYRGKYTGFKKGDPVYRLTDVKLNQEITEKLKRELPKRKINGVFRARLGEECSLTYQTPELSVTTDGVKVEEALNHPTTREQFTKQLSKLGNEPFELMDLELQTDEGIFIRVQELNELRRKTVDDLKHEILQKNKHKSTHPSYKPIKFVNDLVNTYLTVLLRDYNQFAMIVDYNVKRVFLELSSFSMEQIGKIQEICRQREIELGIAVPRILRDDHLNIFVERMEKLKSLGVQLFLVRSGDHLDLLPEGSDKVLDYTFNLMNMAAVDWYKEVDAVQLTASIELNYRELTALSGLDEILVYGFLPLMVSEQCSSRTTTGRCDKKDGTTLKDRKGVEFKLKRDCLFCTETLYNSVPLLLADEGKALGHLGVRSYRIELLDETEDEIRIIFDIVQNLLDKKSNEDVMRSHINKITKFTRGHFRRGVE